MMCLPVKPYRIEREWTAYGLKCAVTQARPGQHRCAYVRVPPSHPLYAEWSTLEHHWDVDLNVHGGITFGDFEPCVEEDGQGFWLGFDFAHAGDAMVNPNVALYDVPEERRREVAMLLHLRLEHPDYHVDEHYWSHDEVVAECERCALQVAILASQLAEGKGLRLLDKNP